MSGSLLDEKENVKSVNECVKQDGTFTTSSILKPSQKENVLLQLTPKKAPKVTFKNTPVRHRPTRYKAELPQPSLDTWEEIRSLDEFENWTERTQVVTKEDHQFHLETAKEFLDDIIDNLPCFKGPTKLPELSKTQSEEDISNSHTKFPFVIEPNIDNPKTMDDGLDVDFAGPLDPAIASLNSLLKAGEEEERAFSPIGSGKVSPDCDNMVTSDDIEKLLAPHDMPDDMPEIPSLELSYGSKIDAFMDSKFSGRHLDEVAAKLNELKLTSTTTNSDQNTDNSEDDLPVIPRGSKKSPDIIEPKEENKEKNETIKNGNEEAALPVKRRQPKTTSKKENEQAPGEEKEKFKKPMPPKPWKTKKKKTPQNDDPFNVVIAEPAKPPPNNTSNIESDNASRTTEDQANQNQNTAVAAPTVTQTEGQNEEVDSAGIYPPEQDRKDNNENKADLNGQALLLEQQEDFGFGNDDFKSSGEAFSLELDYLEKFGNTNNLDRLSALARQSLYVKFDPLCKRGSPDQDLRKTKADAQLPKQTGRNIDDLLMNTPPNRRAPASKLSAIKESDADKLKAQSDIPAVDRLLTFSPAAKGAPTVTREDQTAAPQPTESNTGEEDSSLVQPLLYSKSDIEVAVKKEREALLKQTNEESQVRDMEIQEIFSKLQNEVENNSKLKRENDELRTVMKEYERTMAEMIETAEKNKNMNDESKNEITKERDQLQADLNSVEAAFSDLHRRYEKIKGALENFKKNEEILKKAAQDYQEKLRKSGEKYQMLKKHAEEKIETANIEINRVRRSNDSEMAVMRAALKKEQNKCASLEQAIQQKINENKELTAICDELIQRASGK